MKIKKKKVLSAALFIFFVFTVHAQVSIAPKIGLSYSKLSGDYVNAEYMPGAFFGGMLNYRFHELYSFQSGLLLSGKGTTLNFTEEDDDEMLITYLEVPLNSVLTLLAGSGFVQLFGGPYAGFAINGRYKYLDDENDLMEKLRIGTSEVDEIKPLDLGVNFGAGYMFEGLEVQVAYSRSLSTISNIPNEDIKNNVVTISVAYYFGCSTQSNYNQWYRRR